MPSVVVKLDLNLFDNLLHSLARQVRVLGRLSTVQQISQMNHRRRIMRDTRGYLQPLYLFESALFGQKPSER
ncbi:hypothetical protein ACIBSS_34105 [Micromonospora aurantiaca]|uniref:hypothetical protein n=1 Tax=Micromonospora aurantiaca (nom. illeg.) TaxID=47850 RepID=UPI0037AA7413